MKDKSILEMYLEDMKEIKPLEESELDTLKKALLSGDNSAKNRIIEGHMMPDHVHLLVLIPPKLSISDFIGYLKSKSALMIFDKHANLKYKYGNRKFWARGYYVSTVGLNEKTVAKYIREQEKNDIALDKLSVKEYEDPFSDGGFRTR